MWRVCGVEGSRRRALQRRRYRIAVGAEEFCLWCGVLKKEERKWWGEGFLSGLASLTEEDPVGAMGHGYSKIHRQRSNDYFPCYAEIFSKEGHLSSGRHQMQNSKQQQEGMFDGEGYEAVSGGKSSTKAGLVAQ